MKYISFYIGQKKSRLVNPEIGLQGWVKNPYDVIESDEHTEYRWHEGVGEVYEKYKTTTENYAGVYNTQGDQIRVAPNADSARFSVTEDHHSKMDYYYNKKHDFLVFIHKIHNINNSVIERILMQISTMMEAENIGNGTFLIEEFINGDDKCKSSL